MKLIPLHPCAQLSLIYIHWVDVCTAQQHNTQTNIIEQMIGADIVHPFSLKTCQERFALIRNWKFCEFSTTLIALKLNKFSQFASNTQERLSTLMKWIVTYPVSGGQCYKILSTVYLIKSRLTTLCLCNTYVIQYPLFHFVQLKCI